mmetsp:Transcript_36197/g.91053  ORF Transcript_36197/g.91053 Transcript_36197/m.91053 type:complete len:204 (+) Transcript_36197:881-1492(+)
MTIRLRLPRLAWLHLRLRLGVRPRPPLSGGGGPCDRPIRRRLLLWCRSQVLRRCILRNLCLLRLGTLSLNLRPGLLQFRLLVSLQPAIMNRRLAHARAATPHLAHHDASATLVMVDLATTLDPATTHDKASGCAFPISLAATVGAWGALGCRSRLQQERWLVSGHSQNLRERCRRRTTRAQKGQLRHTTRVGILPAAQNQATS